MTNIITRNEMSQLNQIYEMIDSKDIETVKLGAALLQDYVTSNENIISAKLLAQYLLTVDSFDLSVVAYTTTILYLIKSYSFKKWCN